MKPDKTDQNPNNQGNNQKENNFNEEIPLGLIEYNDKLVQSDAKNNYKEPRIGDRNYPPHCLNTEDSLLSLIISTKGDVLRKINNKINAAYFYLSTNSQIFEACTHIYANNHQVNELALINYFRSEINDGNQCRIDNLGNKIPPQESDRKLNQIRRRIAEIISQSFIVSDCDYLVSVLNEKYYRRKLLQISHQINHMVFDQSISLELAISTLNSSTYLLNQDYVANTKKNSAYLEEAYNQIVDQISNGGVKKTETGISVVDKSISGGFGIDELIVVAGRTSMGKTQVLCDLAYRHWQIHHTPVLFLSCEMTLDQIGTRLMLRDLFERDRNTTLTSNKITTGKITAKEWTSIGSLYSDVARLKIVEFKGEVENIPLEAAQIREENNNQLGLIIIDYVQLLEMGVNKNKKYENRDKELGKIVQTLKNIARDFKCPIILACQINRNTEGRSDKRPNLGDLRDSGSIEQMADQVWLLYRDDYYNHESPDKNILEINLAKLRNGGATGVCKVLLDPGYSCLSNQGYIP